MVLELGPSMFKFHQVIFTSVKCRERKLESEKMSDLASETFNRSVMPFPIS